MLSMERIPDQIGYLVLKDDGAVLTVMRNWKNENLIEETTVKKKKRWNFIYKIDGTIWLLFLVWRWAGEWWKNC